jgi:hypothetical protein
MKDPQPKTQKLEKKFVSKLKMRKIIMTFINYFVTASGGLRLTHLRLSNTFEDKRV